MKVFKIIAVTVLGIWAIYVGYIYLTGIHVTYILPKGYEGPLLIVANQKDGVIINRNNIVYNFTKSNILRVKNSLDEGCSPMGYTNYFYSDKSNKLTELELTDEIKKRYWR